MAVQKKAAFAEESAEVEVLFANLEKLTGLTKKIQGSLNRLETSGRNVQSAMGPIHGSTKHLKVVHDNIDRVTAIINGFKAPMEQRDQEETIIRDDPRRVGIPEYIASLKRADQALRGIRSSNISANQAALKETTALVKYGARQLEELFKQTLLNTGASNPVEPLSYIAKEKLFPIIPREETPNLSTINAFISSSSTRGSQPNPQEMPTTAKIFAEIRGQYVCKSLLNMAAATINTARRPNPDAVYKKGDCSIGSYKVALHGMLAAEFDNIRTIFAPDQLTNVLLATARPAMIDLGKTLRELNTMIQENMLPDCFLAFETLDIITKMSLQLADLAGPELRKPFQELLSPINNTAKQSITRILEASKSSVQRLAMLPPEGAAIPATVETLDRLRTLSDFLNPVISVLGALGDGNWAPTPTSPTSSAAPSIRSLDSTNSTGTHLFVHFSADVLESLVATLDSRARLLLKNQGVQAIFVLNNLAVIEGMIKSHETLSELLINNMSNQSLQPRLDTWRSKHIKLYLNYWGPVSTPLLDVQYTSRNNRRSAANAMNKDSEAIVAAMPSKEKEAIKEKFRAFNLAFDDLWQRHRAYKMEPAVKALLAKEVAQLIEPLYGRFWDRYHEVDRKGKYVKYDKQAIAGQLQALG